MKISVPKPPLRSFAAYWSTGQSELHRGVSLHVVARAIERTTTEGRYLLALVDAAAVVKPEPNAPVFRVMVSVNKGSQA